MTVIGHVWVLFDAVTMKSLSYLGISREKWTDYWQ